MIQLQIWLTSTLCTAYFPQCGWYCISTGYAVVYTLYLLTYIINCTRHQRWTSWKNSNLSSPCLSKEHCNRATSVSDCVLTFQSLLTIPLALCLIEVDGLVDPWSLSPICGNTRFKNINHPLQPLTPTRSHHNIERMGSLSLPVFSLHIPSNPTSHLIRIHPWRQIGDWYPSHEVSGPASLYDMYAAIASSLTLYVQFSISYHLYSRCGPHFFATWWWVPTLQHYPRCTTHSNHSLEPGSLGIHPKLALAAAVAPAWA